MKANDQNKLVDIFFSHHENLSDKWEQYLAIYDSELSRFIEIGAPVQLLEIGVQNGGSLQIWQKYLPSGSEITGIDIIDQCGELALGKGIEVLVGDASDPNKLSQLLQGKKFDIIIDDGSHQSDHIIATFLACFDHLEPAGVYVVEDLHCSYRVSHGGGFRKPSTAIEFFKALSDSLNCDHFEADALKELNAKEMELLKRMNYFIASISFYDSVVVIRKLPTEKITPYRRLITGCEMPISNPSAYIAAQTPLPLREFVLSPAATNAIGSKLIEQLAIAKEQSGRFLVINEHMLADLVSAKNLIEELKRQLKTMTQNRDDISCKQKQADIEICQLKEEQKNLVSHLNHTHEESLALRGQLDELLGSTSWRLTSPMRTIGTQVRHRLPLAQRIITAKRIAGGWGQLIRAIYSTWQTLGWKGVVSRSRHLERAIRDENTITVQPDTLKERLKEKS